MSRRGFEFGKPGSLVDWIRIFCLYRAAFPPSERKPFSRIVKGWRSGRTDIWVFRMDGRFAGFASTINSEKLILIDYLAVEKRVRGQGAGTEALEAMKEAYAGRGLFVEIESMYEPGEEREERMARRRFYEKCGMKPMRVMADVFGVRMELLAWNSTIDFEGYRAFYRDNYSPWAAEHIVRAEYPDEEEIG